MSRSCVTLSCTVQCNILEKHVHVKSYLSSETWQCEEPNPSVGPWAHQVPQVVVSLCSRLLGTVQLCNNNQVIEKGWLRRSGSKPVWHLLCFTWEQHFHAGIHSGSWPELGCSWPGPGPGPGPRAQTSHMASGPPGHWRRAWPSGTLVTIPVPAFLSWLDTVGLCPLASFCSAGLPHPHLLASCPTLLLPDI